MAIITLEPDEKFEHLHKDHSTTTLVRGEVTCSLAGRHARLQPGVPIEIPPDTLHVLHNVGSEPAIVSCYHVPVR